MTCGSVESCSNEVPDVFGVPQPVLCAAVLISLGGRCVVVTR